MARIQFVDVEDLVQQQPRRRKLSPRQHAVLRRESTYEKAIDKLDGRLVAVFRPTEEKLPTLRVSLGRVIARNKRAPDLHFAVKAGAAYVSLMPIPGARRRRSKQATSRAT